MPLKEVCSIPRGILCQADTQEFTTLTEAGTAYLLLQAKKEATAREQTEVGAMWLKGLEHCLHKPIKAKSKYKQPLALVWAYD